MGSGSKQVWEESRNVSVVERVDIGHESVMEVVVIKAGLDKKHSPLVFWEGNIY